MIIAMLVLGSLVFGAVWCAFGVRDWYRSRQGYMPAAWVERWNRGQR